MAMKKTYYTVNGEIIGERTPAGGRIDYLTDALGNVTATMNQSAAIVNTYRYKPYGDQLAKTGTGSDPKYRFVGNQGYRQTSNKYSDVYIRARHFDERGGRWASVDPLQWRSSGQEYNYVAARPTVLIDFSGLMASSSGASPCAPSNCCDSERPPIDKCPKGNWFGCPEISPPMILTCSHIRPSQDECNAAAALLNSWLDSCGGLSNPSAGPWDAYTPCCVDVDPITRAPIPRLCGKSKCCSGTFPYGGGINSCLRLCLLEHEGTHRLMCFTKKPNDPPELEEYCAYGMQAVCLYNALAEKCAGVRALTGRITACKQRLKDNCLARITKPIIGVITPWL